MAKNIGAEYIIAPMVETSYALSKYILAKNKVWSEEERKNVQFLFNLETITTYNNMMIPINCMNVITHYEDGTPALGLGPLIYIPSSKHHCVPHPDSFRETHTCGLCSVICP
jgi:hypothetical protein